MARQKRFQVRLNDDEWLRLHEEANRRNVSMSEVIQDYIKRLPKPKRTLHPENRRQEVNPS